MVGHNARDRRDRDPFGALPLGAQVSLCLEVSPSLEAGEVTAVLFYDDDRGHPIRQTMRYEGERDGKRRYRVEFSPPRTGLGFYYFAIGTERGTLYVKRDGGEGGNIDS